MTIHETQYWALSLPYLRAMQGGTLAANADYWAARGAVRSSADVTVIPVAGIITQRDDWYGTSIDSLRARFRSALADGSKAIVFHFDSPGGSVYGVEEFATEIRAARGTKPIVAAVDPLSASAAFWLSSQADKTVVTPSGEIGSVGVYGMHVDMSAALDQMGVVVTFVSAGEGKVDGNPYEALSETAKADMQAGIERYYGAFTSGSSKGRGVPVATVRSDWKAKVYGAKDAVANGMADVVGTIDDAIRLAGSMAMERRSTAASVDREVESRRRVRERNA